MSDQDQVQIAREFVENLAQAVPELSEVLNADGPLDVDALDELMQEPEISVRVAEFLGRREEFDKDDLALMVPEQGMPRINPMWEAALLERLQYDGDVPEFRHGPLQPGQKAAVPVDTEISNPAMIGMMLEDVSNQVTSEIVENRLEAIETVNRLMGDARATGNLRAKVWDYMERKGDTEVLVDELVPLVEKEPVEYQRGKKAGLMKASAPSVSALVSLSTEESQQAIWKTKSTTQGRRSALKPIAKLMLGRLQRHLAVDVSDEQPNQSPIASATWVSRLDEAGHLNPNFNFIHAASAVLSNKLRKRVGELGVQGRKLLLTVSTIDSVSERRVGWKADLFFEIEAPQLS